jgi:hypothetical protein
MSERLEERSRASALEVNELVQRYVEEGLRGDEHPQVVFRDGPAGRRAGLAAGPDVWEMIGVVRAHDGDVIAAAAYLELPLRMVEAGVAYYQAYPEEIERWIVSNDALAEDEHSSWHRRERQRTPAQEFSAVDVNGTHTRSYYLDNDLEAGVLHREDGPALIIEDANGTRCEDWYHLGRRHREDGPATITVRADGSRGERYCREGEWHREDGPAYLELHSDGGYVHAYYREGRPYCENGVARLEVRADGTRVSESATIGWQTAAWEHPQHGTQQPVD